MAHTHGRHDSCRLQKLLWRETDLRFCDVGEVSPLCVDFAIVHCSDEMEQQGGGRQSVRRVKVVLETAGLAARLSW